MCVICTVGIYLCLERVSAADIRRVADRIMSSKPSVVGYGNLKDMPDYDAIEMAVVKRDTSPLNPRKTFHFLGR